MKKIIIAIACFLMASCEKEIIVNQLPYETRVSIQCALEPGETPTLYMYRTAPYFEQTNLKSLFVRNALVVISDSDGKETLYIDSVYNFIKCEYEYFYAGRKPVIANRKYDLSIDWEGRKYTASTVTDPVPVQLVRVEYVSEFFDVYGGHEGVIPVFRDITGRTNYYRYEMYREIDTTMVHAEGDLHSPCIGDSSVMVYEISRSVYSNINYDPGDEIKIVIEPAYTHNDGMEGEEGIVRIQTIDKNIYDFFEQLDRQKLSQRNPFVEPVFLTGKQFGNAAIGYFGAMTRSNPVLFVFPE